MPPLRKSPSPMPPLRMSPCPLPSMEAMCESPTATKARLDGLATQHLTVPDSCVDIGSPDQYKRSVSKDRRGSRFHTMPITFNITEIKEVDEESFAEAEPKTGNKHRIKAAALARSQSCRASQPSPRSGLGLRRGGSFRTLEASIEEVAETKYGEGNETKQ